MDESGMITESEQFLNEIERKGIDAGNLNDLDSFLEVYNYLSSNLEKLQEMRELLQSATVLTESNQLLQPIKSHWGTWMNMLKSDAVSAKSPIALQVLLNVAWCANADVRTSNLKSIIPAFTALK